MKKILTLLFIAINSSVLTGQVDLIQQGEVISNSLTGSWEGVNISRVAPARLSFLNNSITSVNASGYLLQAGDEVPATTNNNLDGAVITGNKLTWNGTDQSSITHGMFLGYNINYTVKYNYLDKTPYGILFKSGTDAGGNMTYSSGYGAAYNIVRNSRLSVRMKGINGVQIYNNTFYSNQGSGSIILIDANHDRDNPASSTGAKIKNNIFYTVYQIDNIAIESGCLAGFESDYNVYYCESGPPVFSVDGARKTFSQWQAMGYDLHSVVVNPNFTNTTDLVPRSRLDYGVNLGTAWQSGLSSSAKWVPGTSPARANQNGKWQAGALIYPEVVVTVAQPPVYVSSSVENVTPSLLEMAYSLTLASIVPPVSAFSVKVNSVTRNINSVAVSGTNVRLTLSNPVVYGDVVTVAYTKPATSPLQTPSAGLAATITPRSVVNRVSPVVTPPPPGDQPAPVNSPPVIVINPPTENPSGFVGELDATGSYDPNHDNLSYTWIAPANISVSGVNSSKIQFLSPVVSTEQTVEFTLRISDGKSVQSQTVPVVISPYKPELEAAEVVKIDASDYQSPYYPHNIIDGNIRTMWSVNGDDQWVVLQLKEPFSVQHIKLAFQPGQQFESYFDILASEDGMTWEPVLNKEASCPFSGDLQVFAFPESKTSRDYNFIKLVGHSNSADSWNHVSEFKIFGYRWRDPKSYEDQPVKLYPNPATVMVNVKVEDTSLNPDFIKIVSLTGKVLLEEQMNPLVPEIQIPLELPHGTYIVQIGTGNITLFTQRLVIARDSNEMLR